MTDHENQLPPHSPMIAVATSEQHQDELRERLNALAEEIDSTDKELDSPIDDIPIKR